tara:strand:+ start:3437 stop:3547 length:111 start_codon:yes stop_codon:yes gene_type:complete
MFQDERGRNNAHDGAGDLARFEILEKIPIVLESRFV